MNLAFVHSSRTYSLVFIQMDSQEENTCKTDFYSKVTVHMKIGVGVWAKRIMIFIKFRFL